MDQSNGYEGVAVEFLTRRGRAHGVGIGSKTVRAWARTLPRGATVLDLGCGSGFPITLQLIAENLNVYAIDAAPSMVQAFRENFPAIPVVCEAAEDSTFFRRSFDAVLSVGLIFLLSPSTQRGLLQRIADVIEPGGRLLFTAGASPLEWNDAMTGLRSYCLGAEGYKICLSEAGLSVTDEYEDEGQNHYFDAIKHNRPIPA